jgi:VanZ family protein
MLGKIIPGVVCALVLVGTLAAGLWPFHRVKNAVTWLDGGNGLHFGGNGAIVSSRAFRMEAPADQASSTLEIWLEPQTTNASSSLMAFSTRSNPLQLSLYQYHSLLILTHENPQDHQSTKIGIENAFRPREPVFVTITSGERDTTMYLNGALARRFGSFRLARDFTGTLVFGTSPVDDESWPGELRGLALYHRELTAEEVRRHYETWTTQARPEIRPGERAAALYLFDEHAGNVAHNAIDRGIDLDIPARYSLVHERLLRPFWEEYKPDVNYAGDVLVNIAGLVPLGFVFCRYWSSTRSRYPAMAATALGFLVSLSIEVLQSYLPHRASGTTDLFTNTLGAWLGAKLYVLTARRTSGI